jgi:hypothetical protein
LVIFLGGDFGSGFGTAPCGQIVKFSNLVLSFQFSFLPLVKVLVNFGLRLFGESFGQVKLAQILFSGKIHFWQSQVSKIGFVSSVKSFGKFGSGWFVKIRFAGKVGFCFADVFG